MNKAEQFATLLERALTERGVIIGTPETDRQADDYELGVGVPNAYDVSNKLVAKLGRGLRFVHLKFRDHPQVSFKERGQSGDVLTVYEEVDYLGIADKDPPLRPHTLGWFKVLARAL